MVAVAVAVAVVAIADDNDNDDDGNDGMVFELVVMVLLYTVDVDDYWLAMSLAA